MARILVIDDDEEVRDLLQETLTRFGHAISVARNGKEGLEKFQQAGADLIITDIVMPEKEGLETILGLRRHNPNVKIIAISGGGLGKARDYLQIAKQMGAARVLTKPFFNQALLTTVQELLADA